MSIDTWGKKTFLPSSSKIFLPSAFGAHIPDTCANFLDFFCANFPEGGGGVGVKGPGPASPPRESRPRGGACGREMPPCLCVCALVCLRGWGCGRPACSTVVRHQRTGKCVPGAPSPGRESGELDAEAAGGVVGLGLQPPRHKDKLSNSSTATRWHGKTVVRCTTGWQQLVCLRNLLC